MNRLIVNKSIETFINASMDFVEETDMLSLLDLLKTKELIETLNKLPILSASMNQLGRSVYTICEEKQEKDVLEVYDSFKPEIKVYNLEINESKPKIITK